jgi:hypothetical protein
MQNFRPAPTVVRFSSTFSGPFYSYVGFAIYTLPLPRLWREVRNRSGEDEAGRSATNSLSPARSVRAQDRNQKVLQSEH